MKTMIALMYAMVLLPSAALATNSTIVINVTNVNALASGRQAVVDVNISDTVSISKKATLRVLIGTDKRTTRPDEFGIPQNFLLQGTSHEIDPHHFRVAVALPEEKVKVRFILRDKEQTLADENSEL